MKVKEIHDIDGWGIGSLRIEVNGKYTFSFYANPECPEDFTFNRDVSDAYEIVGLMQMAYEAGKNGEPFEYEFVNEREEDDEE